MFKTIGLIALLGVSCCAAASNEDAATATYDPVLLRSYLSNARQFHAPLFAAMETYCQIHHWPTSGRMENTLKQTFNMQTSRFRFSVTAHQTLAMQYQPWPLPDWFVTIQPSISKINRRPYFHLHLTSSNNQAVIGVDGMAYCHDNHHLSDIVLLLRQPNQTTPATLNEIIHQRQLAIVGKTPHMEAAYRGT